MKNIKDLRAAVQDEVARLNAAIDSGEKVVLHTFAGDFPVKAITDDLWAHCGPDQNGVRPPYPFMLANDDTFAGLLAQAKVERNPLFAG